MRDALATDDRGNALVAFHGFGGWSGTGGPPMPLSLVAWWHDGRLLLVFNQYRQQWELPGGMIEPEETPRRAALRELREETGYVTDDVVIAGYAQFALGAEQRPEYAAVFTTDAIPLGGDFVATAEIGAVCWWDGVQPLSGRVQTLDVLIGRLARACAR
ncbi:NUDIX hydrolase [Micromonospora echinospora]|uniref:NUDIX hydrolase n=1 Tax=Micromonospora echinospora TaxID=1877 RepID=UPI00366E7E50